MQQDPVENLDARREEAAENLRSSPQRPTTLIMKGGGIKGLAYIGALEVLSENGYQFKWFAGTSAGAITAILLGAGYRHIDLLKILSEKNFNDFKDANVFQALKNLLTKGGLYEAETFTDWMDEKLAEKLGTHNRVWFIDLKKSVGNRITIFASREGTKVQVFDTELKESEKIPVAFAARSSMAIPFFFVPTYINGYATRDGGLQNNYPVKALLAIKPKTKFIGLYLGPEIFKGVKKKNLIKEILSITTEADDEDALRIYEDDTIVIDPHPISTLDFKLSYKEKEFLLESGRLATIKFLNKRGELDLPNNYTDRKGENEALRDQIIKVRKFERIKRIVIIIAILIATLSGMYFFSFIKNHIANYSKSYRSKVVKEIGLEATLFRKQQGVRVSVYDRLNNPDSLESPCNFLPREFIEESIDNKLSIDFISVTDNEICLKFHSSDLYSNYSGLRFRIKNLTIKDLLKSDDEWSPYNCINPTDTINNEFLLRNPKLTGEYEFKAKLISK